MRVFKALAKAALPDSKQLWLRNNYRRIKRWPPVGMVRFGSLRTVSPISSVFGFDRGQCIDRYYIEIFLRDHALDIRGHVIEVGDDCYTHRFGGDQVCKSEILHATSDNPRATIVADLTSAESILSDSYDCIVLTQTLQFIYDTPAAIRTLYRILKPNGVLLATFPGISQISRYDMDRWGDYWRFTTGSACKLFKSVFPPSNVVVKAYGNVLSTVAFLHGLSAEELKKEELDYHDPDYQMVIAIRAVKPNA